MTDIELLQEKIKARGVKLEWLAERMGITRYSLRNKMTGAYQFKQAEIKALCEALDITDPAEIQAIFLA